MKTIDEKLPATPEQEIVEDSDFGHASMAAPQSNKTTAESDLSFDPYNFGKEDGVTCFGACVHIVRSTIGSGILIMPFAMKNLGLLYGTILIFFTGILYYHSIHILVSTEYQLCKLLKLKRLSFVGVIRRSLHRAPFPINKFESAVSHLAHFYLSFPTSSATYLIVMSTNIRLMADFYDVQLNDKLIIAVIVVPIMLFTQKRSILKILVPFSSITNIFTVAMILVIVSCSFIYQKADFNPTIIGDIYFIPKGFAMFMMALRCTGFMLPLKNSMKNPKRFSDTCGSLNVAGFSIVIIYYSFSLASYINYEDTVQENILSNLPSKNYVSFVVYLLYTLSLLVGYTLAFFSCFDNFWSNELESQFQDGLLKTICERCIRLGLNLVIFFLAVVIPRISLIAAMNGTLGILIGLGVPPFLQIILQISEKKIRCISVLKNLFVMALSGVLFCMSAARCVRDIIHLYSD